MHGRPYHSRRTLTNVERAARATRLQSYRAGRLLRVAASSYSAANYTVYIVTLSFTLTMAFPALMMSLEMIFGDKPFDPNIFTFWALIAVLAGSTIAYWIFRRTTARACRAALDRLAHSLGEIRHATVHLAVGWFNAYWSGLIGPLEVQSAFLTGPCFNAVVGFAAGYPFLVWADPVAPASGRGPRQSPRLEVFIAASFPSDSLPSESTLIAYRKAFGQQGFDCYVTEAGISLFATMRVVRWWRRTPSTALLDGALRHAAQMADALGGSPAEPM
jgi:hypothetical protein